MFGPVDWNAEKVDDEYAFLTVTPIEVYGQELADDVYNLLHVHIPSLGESATVDLRYMKKYDETEKFMKFEKDITGTMLKYRILIQNGCVKTILYNFRGKIRELGFRETKFKVGEIVDVTRAKLPDNALYARITAIPIQTLAALDSEKLKAFERTAPNYELMSFCKSRYFEELQGFIDVELIPNAEEKPDKFKPVSVPVCECVKGIEGHKKAQALFQKWKDKVTSKCSALVTQLKQRLDELKSKMGTMNVAEKKSSLEYLQSSDAELMTLSENESNGVDIVFP